MRASSPRTRMPPSRAPFSAGSETMELFMFWLPLLIIVASNTPWFAPRRISLNALRNGSLAVSWIVPPFQFR